MEKPTLGLIITIIFSVIGFLAVYFIVGAMSPTIVDSSEAISYPNNCTYVFNVSDGKCYNSTSMGGGELSTAKMYSLPMSALFTPSGALMIVFMVGIFILLLVWVFKMAKGK